MTVFSYLQSFGERHTTRGWVGVAFTDASVDLAEGAPGRALAEAKVLERLAQEPSMLPPQGCARMLQVHSDDVAVVTTATQGSPVTADALVTTTPGLALQVRVADCLPVVLADPAAGVVAVAHAGRRGAELDIVTRTVAQMRRHGAQQVSAWIGPHVCGACYEVPASMQAEAAVVLPEAVATTSWGTPSLDLAAGVRAQLERAGVEVLHVGACTLENNDLASYRRDGAASTRMAGWVWRA